MATTRIRLASKENLRKIDSLLKELNPSNPSVIKQQEDIKIMDQELDYPIPEPAESLNGKTLIRSVFNGGTLRVSGQDIVLPLVTDNQVLIQTLKSIYGEKGPIRFIT